MVYSFFNFLLHFVVLTDPKPPECKDPCIAPEFRIPLCSFRFNGSRCFYAVFGGDKKLWPVHAGGQPDG